MDLKITANTIEVTNMLKGISRKQTSAIKKSLNRVSNMAVQMITVRTQKGLKPDGGTFKAYSQAYKKSKDFQKKRNRGRVDLTLSGQMFRSLDFRQRGFKNTLLFANKDMEKRAFKHDTGVGKLPVRPFFSIGRKEEGKIRAEFNKFYFSQLRI